MAEQAKQQEAQVELPAVRSVRLTEAVVLRGFPGADKIDCLAREARRRKLAVTLTAFGPLCRYLEDGKRTAENPNPQPEWRADLIPWRMVKGVDVSPEWKP